MIVFGCPGCAKKFQAKEEFAGRRTRCPDCGREFLVPTPGQGEVQAAAPPRFPAVRPPDPDPDVREPEAEPVRGHRRRAPLKKSARKKILLISGAVLLGLFLTGGLVAGVYWLFFRPVGLTNELLYVPDNFEYIASLNVSGVQSSELYVSLKREIDERKPDLERELQKLENDLGLKLTEIERVTVAGLFPRPGERSGPEFVVVVKTKRPVELRELFKGPAFAEFQDRKVGEHTVRLYDPQRMAVCALPNRTILFSSHVETLSRVLKRDRKADVSEGMQEAMNKTDFTQALAVSISTRDLRRDLMRDREFRNDMARSFGSVIEPEKLLELTDMTVMHIRLGSKVEVEAKVLGKDTEVVFKVSVKTSALIGLLNKGEWFQDRGPVRKDFDRKDFGKDKFDRRDFDKGNFDKRGNGFDRRDFDKGAFDKDERWKDKEKK